MLVAEAKRVWSGPIASAGDGCSIALEAAASDVLLFRDRAAALAHDIDPDDAIHAAENWVFAAVLALAAIPAACRIGRLIADRAVM